MARSKRLADTASKALTDAGGFALSRLVKRLRRGSARRAGPAGAEAPGDAIVLVGRGTSTPRVLIAVVIGLDAALLESTLAVIAANADRSEGAVETLCLTDCTDFEQFRRHRLLFEYLPPALERERFVPDLDWNLYTLRRLARLRRKWNPVRIVAFGPQAQAQVECWRTSPFEDEGILDLIRAPEAGAMPGVASD
jgi:hypothetical protein